MPEKKFLLAANWKMNSAPFLAGGTTPQLSALEPYRPRPDVDVVVFPTFLDLKDCLAAGLIVGAQSAHPAHSGAHTGDVSMEMVRKLGCTHLLCGHSERRAHHGEHDGFVAQLAREALTCCRLHPLICVGETAEEREIGEAKHVVDRQIGVLLPHLRGAKPEDYTIAYEPVWAIGTGKTATPEDAQQMHAFIRSLLSGISAFAHLRIIYGGSAKAANAEALLKQPDIDGLLVGGASLDPKEFKAIIDIAVKLARA